MRIRLLYSLHSLASLAYQTIWIKTLAVHLGMSLAAMGTVMGCFVGGLGMGAFLLSWLAENKDFSTKKIFIISQYGLALWSIALTFLLIVSDSLYVSIAPPIETTSHHLVRIVVSMFILMPPSILIGIIFPLLSGEMEKIGKEGTGSNTARLYKDGLIYSALGCILIPVLLIPQFGLQNTNILMGLLSFIVGTIGIWFLPTHGADLGPDPYKFNKSSPLSIQFLFIIAFVLGFVLFSVEIIGAKYLWLIVDTTVYAEGFLIGIVLIIMTIGSLTYLNLRKNKIRSISILIVGGMIFISSLALWISIPHHFSSFFFWIKDLEIGSPSSYANFFLPFTLLPSCLMRVTFLFERMDLLPSVKYGEALITPWEYSTQVSSSTSGRALEFRLMPVPNPTTRILFGFG